MILAFFMALGGPVAEVARALSPDWLASFHRGDTTTLEGAYRAHVRSVVDEAARLLRTADAETIAHDVFLRLLSDPSMREGFRGGDLGAWLRTIARRSAIDLLRRRRREELTIDGDDLPEPPPDPTRERDERDAKLLVDRFRTEILPEKYRALFDVRFLRQLSQRDAAEALGIRRSTLAYQEERVRQLLTTFLLDPETIARA